MEQKLHQMDDILNTILSQIDSSTNCEVAFIFGDHGMTEDGNHGGGTYDETNAGLFAHYSPNCGDFGPSLNISGQEVGSYSNDAFQSINQIDLVPTISLLLGLPIPYANLGGVVPALLPPLQHKSEHIANELVEAPFTATALALNAAQVWNYLTTYSSSANKLPQEAMSEIESILSKATDRLRDAISGDGFDSISYREACGLYKYFLSQATDLGKQVWTRFDTFGMGIGIILLISSLMMRVPFLSIYPTFAIETIDPRSMKQNDAVIAQRKRLVLSLMTLIFVVFHCMIMTFSNSYILSEQSIVIFMVSFLCTIETVFRFIFRVSSGSLSWMHVLCPILTMLCVRINSFVTGHGQDPMIRKYWAHHTHVFLMSLFVLVITRVSYFLLRTKRIRHSIIHSMLDITALSCLAISWIEKRSSDIARHGYRSSAIAISLCAVGILLSAVDLYSRYMNHRNQSSRNDVNKFHDVNVCLFHFLIFTVTVTGPSAATSSLLILIHTYVFWFISNEKGVQKVGYLIDIITNISQRLKQNPWKLTLNVTFCRYKDTL
jgi:phosphatidylinositol glycan class O